MSKLESQAMDLHAALVSTMSSEEVLQVCKDALLWRFSVALGQTPLEPMQNLFEEQA